MLAFSATPLYTCLCHSNFEDTLSLVVCVVLACLVLAIVAQDVLKCGAVSLYLPLKHTLSIDMCLFYVVLGTERRT